MSIKDLINNSVKELDSKFYGAILWDKMTGKKPTYIRGKIKKLITDQIQKAYSNGREEVLKELRVRIDTWGGFEDEGGNLCHYDSQIIEYLENLSIQSKEK
jgi:hypothetical protein